MKLTLVTPGDTFTGGCVESLLETLAHCIRHNSLTHIREYSSDIYTCREQAATKAVDHTDYDYMLWADSDMTWKWADVVKMIEADVPIISGVCLISPFKSNAAKFGKDEKGLDVLSYLNGWRLGEAEKTEKGLIQVDMVGFGFLLFKKGVFEALERPWFRQGTVTAPDGRGLVSSEDMMFTTRCREAGFPIYVHPEVFIGHQKRQTLIVAKDEVKDG